MLAFNLSAMLGQAAQPLVNEQTHGLKHAYQVNHAQALSRLKAAWVRLFQSSGNTLSQLIDELISIIAACREAIRPDRSYPRKQVGKKKARFPVAYKRVLCVMECYDEKTLIERH